MQTTAKLFQVSIFFSWTNLFVLSISLIQKFEIGNTKPNACYINF